MAAVDPMQGNGAEAGDLRGRILLVALAPLFLAVVVLAGYLTFREWRHAESTALDRGRAMVQRVAEGAAFDLYTGNDAALQRLIDREALACACVGLGIADQGGAWRVRQGRLSAPPPRDILGGTEWLSGHLLHFAYPILGRHAGIDDAILDSGSGQGKQPQGVVLGAAPQAGGHGGDRDRRQHDRRRDHPAPAQAPRREADHRVGEGFLGRAQTTGVGRLPCPELEVGWAGP